MTCIQTQTKHSNLSAKKQYMRKVVLYRDWHVFRTVTACDTITGLCITAKVFSWTHSLNIICRVNMIKTLSIFFFTFQQFVYILCTNPALHCWLRNPKWKIAIFGAVEWYFSLKSWWFQELTHTNNGWASNVLVVGKECWSVIFDLIYM